MASISFRNLSKVYPNGVAALRGANLEIADGERLALVGPSGCGKSTSLRLIAGLEEATSGEIHLAGQPAGHLAPRDRNIAMVFQDDALYPHMTARKNIAFALRMRKVPTAEIERRIATVSRLLSIESLLGFKPYVLSGGQRQRIALGRAMVRDASIFLFDEPLSSLDAHQREAIRSEIIEWHERIGKTMVYVTHDQAEAMSFGNRVAVMNHGVIEQVAAPMELYHHPANRFVASFIGSPAMTLLDGIMENGIFRCQNATLPLNAGCDDGPATLGVRPEDWVIDATLPSFAEVRVESVQRLGHETLVQFSLGDISSYARMASDCAVTNRDLIRLAIRPGRWHLFSGDGSAIR